MSRSAIPLRLPAQPCARDPASVATRHAARWCPGLGGSSHSEVFADSDSAAGAGLALALAQDAALAGAGAREERPLLWVQDRAAIRLAGWPYRPGLPPALRHRLIHVAADRPEDALFAIEEALQCRDLACVIGEIAGNPKALDFTASRRLSLMAQRHGAALWLVRLDAARDLSSARLRWQVCAASSRAPQWNAQAPGAPRWQAELFRSRNHPPGEWIMHHDGHNLSAIRAAAPHPVGLAFVAGGRSLAAG